MTNSERNGPRPEKSTIEPLGGWSPHTPDGLLKKCGASADDRLEVLSVLFAWMMRELELPSKLAVNKICNALAAGTELYLLNDGDYAEVLPANHSFEYFPFVNLNEPERKPSDENVGLTGAIKHLREYWSESRAFGASKSMGEHVLDPLAVRLSDADLFWGYCPSRLKSVVEPVAAHSSPEKAGEPVTQAATQETEVAPLSLDFTTASKPRAGQHPLTTPKIAEAFSCVWSGTKALSDPGKWLLPARRYQGKAPKSSTWCPIALAELLKARGTDDDALKRLFLTEPLLKPWLLEWQTARRELNAFGQ